MKDLKRGLERMLKDDILRRYHNSDYWDIDLIEMFREEHGLTKMEINQMLKEIDRI